MSSANMITEAHVGHEWTYEGAQVFRIINVSDSGVALYDVRKGSNARDPISHERLEMLFECGRAEWGDSQYHWLSGDEAAHVEVCKDDVSRLMYGE